MENPFKKAVDENNEEIKDVETNEDIASEEQQVEENVESTTEEQA